MCFEVQFHETIKSLKMFSRNMSSFEQNIMIHTYKTDAEVLLFFHIWKFVY